MQQKPETDSEPPAPAETPGDAVRRIIAELGIIEEMEQRPATGSNLSRPGESPGDAVRRHIAELEITEQDVKDAIKSVREEARKKSLGS